MAVLVGPGALLEAVEGDADQIVGGNLPPLGPVAADQYGVEAGQATVAGQQQRQPAGGERELWSKAVDEPLA